AERQAHDLAEREAALKHKADGIKETLKGKKRFDLRQLQILAQTGEGFSFGGEDGEAVNIEGKRAIKKRKAAEKAESKAKEISKKAEPKKKAPATKEGSKAKETPKKAEPKKKAPAKKEGSKAKETPKKAEPKKKAPAKKKVVVKDEPPAKATLVERPLAISEDAQLEEALKVEDI
ncbi:MAG: hypothetical protein QGG50_04710, partial [Methanopyri archaeon]|nr:hypothetical protein [Methanopyri archaeon]